MREQRIYPSLLSNTPCKDDLFKGAAHRNIAKVIAKQIVCDKKCHMIGIDGGWGAGKSNLIELVKKELNGDKIFKESEYPVYVYDAWGHLSDLQRRSILEEIIKKLTDAEVLESSWKESLKNLLAKRRNTTIKKYPKLNFSVKVFAILTFLTPLITYLVSLIPKDSWYTWLVALSPYLLGAVWVYNDRKKSMKQNNQEASFSGILDEMFYVYTNNIKEDETFEIISENEPTSAQFKEWMHKLDDSIAKSRVKRLILVFDNLDRMPIAKVQEFWAAIHSFFAEETYNNITVIVPFDRKHIINAFKKEDISESNSHYGNDFINKTFVSVYRVSPPLMTGWKDFFNAKWKEAFGPDEAPDNVVTQIYDLQTIDITPRNIIAFINELVTIKQTSVDSIPARYCAIFVFGREKIAENPIGEILAPTYLGSSDFLFKNDSDMSKYISALFYQLPVKDAMDVIYTRECRRALDDKDSDLLMQLLQDENTFKSIFENAIKDVSNIENAVLCLSYIPSNALSEKVKQFVWHQLYLRAMNINMDWSEYCDFHKILLQSITDSNHKQDFAKTLVTAYESKNEETDSALYIEGIDNLRAVDADLIFSLLNNRSWIVGPRLFLSLVASSKLDWEKYGFDCNNRELQKYIEDLSVEQLSSLVELPKLVDKLDCKVLSAVFSKKLKEKASDKNSVAILISRIKEIDRPVTNIKETISDQEINNLVSRVSDKEELYYELMAMALARGTAFTYRRNEPYSSFGRKCDSESVEKIANIIEYYVTYGTLLTRHSDYSSIPIMEEVVRTLTSETRGESVVAVNDVIYGFDDIVTAYELKKEVLLDRLDAWTANVENLDPTRVPLDLLELVVTSEKKISLIIKEAIKSHYNKLNQEEWKDAILGKTLPFKMWLIYHPGQVQNYFDAIKEILKDSVDEAKIVVDNADMNKLLEISEELNHDVNSLSNDLLGQFTTGHRQTKELFKYLGRFILSHSQAELKKRDSFARFVPSDILEDNDVIAILQEKVDVVKTCMINEETSNKLKQMARGARVSDEVFIAFVKEIGITLVDETEP